MNKLSRITLAVSAVAMLATAQEQQPTRLDLPEEVNSKHSRICGDFHWRKGTGYNPNDERMRCEIIQRRIWIYNARIRNALELENVSDAFNALMEINLMLENEEQIPAYNIGERTLTRFKSEIRSDIRDAHEVLVNRIRLGNDIQAEKTSE